MYFLETEDYNQSKNSASEGLKSGPRIFHTSFPLDHGQTRSFPSIVWRWNPEGDSSERLQFALGRRLPKITGDIDSGKQFTLIYRGMEAVDANKK